MWHGLKRRVFLAGTILVAATAARVPAQNWPSFRGPNGTGVGTGTPPTTWNVETGENIKWKTAIPGLSHASPIVWGERVFLATAVSSEPDPHLKVGMYGSGEPVPDEPKHEWRLLCLDRKTGKILWQKTAHAGSPKVKRHPKATQANSTPATDGKRVVAFFGSEGLYCYDMSGTLLWKKDFGKLDAGPYNAPDLQWGFASSPVLVEDRVIVQCDVHGGGFLAVLDADTGKEIWRAARDDVSTWSTPTVYVGDDRSQVIVNGYRHIGGYDLRTGKELWKLRGGGDVPVPTPFVAHGLIFITNAHGRLRPIYAIRPSATGDITPAEGESSNASIAWWRDKRGAYIPTPVVYGDLLYIGDDHGILTTYDAKSGEKVYRLRVIKGQGGAYTASPVAAGGKVFLTGEDGDILVIKAGREYELLATNSMNAICMATPAIADGQLFIRTKSHLYCIAE